MILKPSPQYKPLVQMKYCCAACSILWILHRRGYWVDQEIIAKEIGIKIPKKFQKLFRVKMKTTRKRSEYGAPRLIAKDSHLVNRFLKKYKIPLKMTPFKISKIKDPKKFIIDNLKKGNDLMLSFHWRGLGKRWNWGHVCVLAEFDTARNIVTIGDPAYNMPKFWKINLHKLVRAMSSEWDGRERGFYVFENHNTLK